MKDQLAERLLAEVMDWSVLDVSRERPYLQAFARYKYDEYQQFGPGMRFIESLALWLQQFELKERRVAYDFVKHRLLFFSGAEMAHLVRVAYPDHIRPHLLQSIAVQRQLPPWLHSLVAGSPEFIWLRRQTLFLGLSDGAQIDLFRRSNSPELSHEQIYLLYEPSLDRAQKLLGELKKDLVTLGSREERPKFKRLVLIDDFSGSATSYFRRSGQSIEGKIGSILSGLRTPANPLSGLFDLTELSIYIVLYVATAQARSTLETALAEEAKGLDWQLEIVQELGDDTKLTAEGDPDFVKVAERYYDPSVEDRHIAKGGVDDVRLGFARCATPLVLSHNTPNNSPFILWAHPIRFNVRGLFPRVERHT